MSIFKRKTIVVYGLLSSKLFRESIIDDDDSRRSDNWIHDIMLEKFKTTEFIHLFLTLRDRQGRALKRVLHFFYQSAKYLSNCVFSISKMHQINYFAL